MATSCINLRTTLQLPPSQRLPTHWKIDSSTIRGYDFHYCCNRAMFTTYSPLTSTIKLRMGGSSLQVVGTGSVHMPLDKGKLLILRDVLCIPYVMENSISTFQLDGEQFSALKAYLALPLEKRTESLNEYRSSNTLAHARKEAYKQDNHSTSVPVQNWNKASALLSRGECPAIDLKTRSWVIDSGADGHLCFDRNLFTDFSPFEPPIFAKGISAEPLQVTGHGTVRIATSGGTDLVLTDVWFAPHGAPHCGHLISTSQLADTHDCVVTFYKDICSIAKVFQWGSDNTHQLIPVWSGTRINHKYWLDEHDSKVPVQIVAPVPKVSPEAIGVSKPQRSDTVKPDSKASPEASSVLPQRSDDEKVNFISHLLSTMGIKDRLTRRLVPS